MAAKKATKETKTSTTKKLSTKEIEDLIVKLAEKNTSLSKIGLILKQEHGVPRAKLAVGKIRNILKQHKIDKIQEILRDM